MANQGIWTAGMEAESDKLNAGLWQRDTLANRPAAGQEGRVFQDSSTLIVYRDNGTTWDTELEPHI